MRFIADVEVGTYNDDYEDVDPRLLARHYGTSRTWRSRAGEGATGAGHSDNEDAQDDDEDAEGEAFLEDDDEEERVDDSGRGEGSDEDDEETDDAVEWTCDFDVGSKAHIL